MNRFFLFKFESAKKWSPPKGSLVSYLCCCSAPQEVASTTPTTLTTLTTLTTHQKAEKVSNGDANKCEVKHLKLSKKEKKIVKMASKSSSSQDQPVKRGAVTVPKENG